MLRPVVAMAALAIGTVLLGTPAAVAQGRVPCAEENGFCRVPYPTRVVYGVPGRSAARDVRERGIPCSNQVFGDPAPGSPKRCAYIARGYGGGYGGGYERPRRERSGYEDRRPRGYDRSVAYDRPVSYDRQESEDRTARWRTCAQENEFCTFRGRMRVRYGADNRFAEGTFRDGVNCNNSIFGDSAPGMRKVCKILN
jgi:hypothetical protein